MLGVLAVGLGSVLFCTYQIRSSLSPGRDPDSYADAVRDRKSWGPELYAFLPDDVDPSAEKVGFYHHGGVGDVICLRLRLPPQRVAEIVREVESAGRRELAPFREFDAPRCYPGFTDEAPLEEDGHENPAPLPTDFRIFNVGATPEEITEEWNHNFRAFIAVSTERSEVVWYADLW